jgi:hypothetical protein
MSVHVIYYKDGAKMMRPILTREEYVALRGSSKQVQTVKAVREGDAKQKSKLLQMNYSCMHGADGRLKGSTQQSDTVGMDIDHIEAGQMAAVKERILQKKAELGLLMLEKSARGEGYHLVFKRRAELSQEENLRWASDLLGVEFDKGAKDITRVFFTTTASEEDMIYLDDEIFKAHPCSPGVLTTTMTTKTTCSAATAADSVRLYNGIPYADIIRKWWDLYNEGKEPVKSNRDVLTFELAVNLRHICGFDRELLGKVIPCYDNFPEAQKMKCIDSALA